MRKLEIQKEWCGHLDSESAPCQNMNVIDAWVQTPNIFGYFGTHHHLYTIGVHLIAGNVMELYEQTE